MSLVSNAFIVHWNFLEIYGHSTDDINQELILARLKGPL